MLTRFGVAVVVVLVLRAAPSPGACPGSCAIPGGGARRTDCLVEFDGVDPVRPRGATVRCTDGDPFCDTDGVVNGSCRFRLTACLNNADAQLPKCRADTIASFTVRRGGKTPAVLATALGSLEAAVSARGLPSGTSACAAPVSVHVPLRGKRRYRAATAIVRTIARTSSGRRDVDRLRFACRSSKTL